MFKSINMKSKIAARCASLFFLLLSVNAIAQITLPFTETFNSSYLSNFYSSAGTSNAGATYTCTSFNGVGLVSSSDYLTTKTLYVGQGQGVSLSFKLNKGGSYTGPVEVYLRVSSATTFSSISPSDYGWVKLGNATSFACGTNTFTIPSEISGGQRLCFTIDFNNPSSTNWVAIEDLSIIEVAGASVPTSFTENFTTDDWYPTSGYVKIPYHSNTSASNGYTWLWSNGTGGAFDYCAAFYTGFDGSSGTHLITPEINTSGYANGELRFAFRSQYPCGGPTSFTFDESYDFYAPEVYIMEGADNGSNSWVRLPVDYYFPDATWRYATADISAYRNANVKFKFERGGFCSNPAESIDNIKVFDRNCTISSNPAGTISGPTNISVNTNFQYSTTAVAGANYYKWFVRSGGTTYTALPYIVSGQGTANVTVNFGNLPAPLRVLCVPYDADPTSNTDACYATTSYLSTSSCTPDTADVSIAANITSICPGEQIDFTATPTNGGITPIYQWKINGIDAATNSATFSTTALNNNDVVTCVMTSSESCITNSPATSNTINITVTSNGTASVSVAGSDTAICTGDQIDFTATPTNGGITPIYDWRVNGSNMFVNSSIFSTSNLDDGDVVTCIMTSSVTCIAGSPATSSAITVSVTARTLASVSIAASATTICPGAQVDFTATPTNGGNAPTYQWKVNGGNAATGSTFSSTTLNDNDVVTCEMTSNAICVNGSPATSNALAITVTSNITASVSIATASTTVCPGEQVDFTATPTNGGNAPTYQWKINGNDVGTNSPAFSTASLNDGDEVTCEMTSNDNCVSSATVISNSLTMSVVNNLTASVSIATLSATTCPGSQVDFTATPTNGGNAPTYQWKINGNDVGTNSATFSSATLNDGDVVTCEMTSNDNCVSSATALSNLLTMSVVNNLTASVSITASATTICPGAQVDFTATPTNGGNAPTYQWKVNGTNAGTNSATFSSTTLNDDEVVTCEMTSSESCVSGSPAVSNPIAVTVSSNLIASVTIATSSTVICPGAQVDFSASPTFGGTAPTYQWKVNGANAGINSATFTSSALNDGDVVNCEMTSSDNCVTNATVISNSITVALATNTAGTIIADKDTLCAWQTAQFILLGSSGSPIRWQSSFSSANNFNDIPNASNDTIDAPITIQSTYYRAIVGSGSCADTTGVLLIVVPQSPVAVFTGIVTDNTVEFNSSSSSGAAGYSWEFGDGNTSVDANPTHVYADSGSYNVCLTVTNSSGCSDTLCANIIAGLPVGINTINENAWSVYPNPVEDVVFIRMNSKELLAQITLHDMFGKTVLAMAAPQDGTFQLSMGKLTAGVYCIRLQTTDGRKATRLIVKE